MIFVTVGASEHSFDRLIKKADEIAGRTEERITAQTGHTKYEPENCRWFRFCSPAEFEAHIKKAKLVVTHGGEGCVMISLKYGKPTVVVPRLKKYGEHINSHQLEITNELERDGRIIAVYDIENLEWAMKRAKSFKNLRTQTKSGIEKAIEGYLKCL